MQCVILAGGLATRMRPITDRLPKALIPVNDMPFASLQLTWLAQQGVTSVVYCVAHLGDQIRDYVGDGSAWKLEVTYSDESPRRLGTAGALRLAASSGLLADRFLVVYGDSYLKVDVRSAWDEWTRSNVCALMVVLKNDGRWDASNADIRDGRVVRYEKGPAGAALSYIDYGLLGFRRDAVLTLPPDKQIDLAGLHSQLASSGDLAAFEVHDRFYEVGSPEGLAELEQFLSNRSG
jgi:N-acetyl-alpha-D-muramate 1-phosphate uridylyltransferase